jgi:hypothetical protein
LPCQHITYFSISFISSNRYISAYSGSIALPSVLGCGWKDGWRVWFLSLFSLFVPVIALSTTGAYGCMQAVSGTVPSAPAPQRLTAVRCADGMPGTRVRLNGLDGTAWNNAALYIYAGGTCRVPATGNLTAFAHERPLPAVFHRTFPACHSCLRTPGSSRRILLRVLSRFVAPGALTYYCAFYSNMVGGGRLSGLTNIRTLAPPPAVSAVSGSRVELANA